VKFVERFWAQIGRTLVFRASHSLTRPSLIPHSLSSSPCIAEAESEAARICPYVNAVNKQRLYRIPTIDIAVDGVTKSWMCRQRLSRLMAPLLLSCLPNRAGKVNSLLQIFSTPRKPSIAASLHLHAQVSPQPRLRRAFTRRGSCVLPSRSAPGPSHAGAAAGKR
jgi:hypothetical protein